MAAPVARLGDRQVCPAVTGTTPHLGSGLLGPGVPSVLIAGSPAAVVGDRAACVGPLATITTGSGTVLIGGRRAARVGSATDHGGSVVGPGAPSVLIGG
jgi:uncharacterized Zn-binding protein involved in type VI secretion